MLQIYFHFDFVSYIAYNKKKNGEEQEKWCKVCPIWSASSYFVYKDIHDTSKLVPNAIHIHSEY